MKSGAPRDEVLNHVSLRSGKPAERYWHDRLQGLDAVPTLLVDRLDPAPEAEGVVVARRGLSGAVVSAVQGLAEELGVTPEVCAVGAWALVLERYTGRRDVVFGVVSHEGRVLPMRVGLERSSGLGPWLRHLASTLDQDRRFSTEDEDPWRWAALAQPLDQVLAFGRPVTASFPLTLCFKTSQGGDLSLDLSGHAHRFERPALDRLAAQLEALLAAMARLPKAGLGDLPILTPPERRQRLGEWDESSRPPAGELSAHQIFEATAAGEPSAVAVVENGREVTYGELARRADELARRLAALGIGPESVIAIALERSLEMVVAMLAVWRAGGAYLPLDLGYPVESLGFMLEDSCVELVLTRGRVGERFAGGGRTIVDLDAELPAATAEPLAAGSLDRLAYVIYTSGSTGEPKGVMVPHRGLADRLRWLAERFDLGPGDRQLQFVSPSFDVSVEEIFVPLVTGAAVVLESGLQHLAPIGVLEVCERRGVTKMNLPASYWHQMVDELEAEDRRVPESLRILATGAETLSPAKLEGWRRRSPEGSVVYNLYGPTEGTILATTERLTEDSLSYIGGSRVPIGRPVGRTAVHLLDRELRQVPLGLAGQLWIGGVGVTRGYLRRPRTTAERFSPDPFSSVPGARLYRTGDLARHLPDGRIDFLGRVDRQIKIRGFRIELDEVEEAVRRLPGVGEVAVVVQGMVSPCLVAHVVAAPGVELDTHALRASCSSRLPPQMIPALFVEHRELPRTAAGKIDRRSLPEPETLDPEMPWRAPGTETERRLAKLWAEVLALERIGADDDWTAIGGDSIKGAIMLSRLEKRLGEYVYPVALFDAPTLAGFAGFLERHYPEAVARWTGGEVSGREGTERLRRLDSVDLGRFRGMVPMLEPFAERDPAPNSRAIFILSPPRSGSTLLRVLLAGNPGLFAPPELELLSFNTLAERRVEFAGRWEFWLEGTLRALMAAAGIDADAARREMEACEAWGLSVKEFYGHLQALVGGRTLVDKTPSYALDPHALDRAEEIFDRPFYIHLVRHPCGMIHSFEKARIDQLFFRREHPFTARQLAELVWTASHINVLEFLGALPAGRHHRVVYEELVADPERVVGELCEVLGIAFDSGMLEPYRERRDRMTDGIHPLAKMLGDVKFHEHRSIDPRMAEKWREAYDHDFLGEPTWELAGELGYERPPEWRAPAPQRSPSPRVEIQKGGAEIPLVCVHAVGGHVECYRDLARRLGPERPVYGLRARGLAPEEEPRQRVDEMATAYLDALDDVLAAGPVALLGWSMGGKIAFEMARRLAAEGREVALLALLDTRADLPRGLGRRRGEAELLLESLEGDDVLPRERLAGLDPGRQLALAVEHLQAVGRLPEDFDGVHRYLRVHLANREAARSYRPRPYAGSAVLYRPAEERPDLRGEPTAGWGPWIEGGIEVQEVSGSHEKMVFSPHVDELAAHLGRRLRGSRVGFEKKENEKRG